VTKLWLASLAESKHWYCFLPIIWGSASATIPLPIFYGCKPLDARVDGDGQRIWAIGLVVASKGV